MKFFPSLATVFGFFISASVGYFVKDVLDQSHINVEVAEMEFTIFNEPSSIFETPTDVIATYDAVPSAFESFSHEMKKPQISGLLEESNFAQVVNQETKVAIERVLEILEQVNEKNVVEKRSMIAKIAGDVRSSNFEQQFKAALRRGQFAQRIRNSAVGDPYYKYRSHPDFWKDPVNARIQIGSSTWDVSELKAAPGDSSREIYEITLTNIFRRMLILVEPKTFGEVLSAMQDEIDNDLALYKDFDDSIESWLREIESEKVVAGIVVSNTGNRPATIETISLMSVAVGDTTVSFPATLFNMDDEIVQSVQVIEPSSTSRYKLVSDSSTDMISLPTGNKLSELASLTQSQILDGRVGLYARSSEGGDAVVSLSPFRMGDSIIADQLNLIREAIE